MRLYAQVARGLLAQGAGASRRTELEAELGGDLMSVHDLSLYLALVNEGPASLDAATLENVQQQLRATPSPSAGLRLAAARAAARAGDLEATEGLLQAALLQALYPSPSTYLEPGDPPLAPAAFVDVLSSLPDPSDRRQAYDALQAVLERQSERASISRFGDLPPLPQTGTP
jgi:hypothetical protein